MSNRSFKDRGGSLVAGALVLLTLFASPLLAQGRVCPPPVSETEGNFTSRIVPLEPAERLLYRLSGVTSGTLEVRYYVDRNLHLTETIDLSRAELPLRTDAKTTRELLQPGAFMQQQDEAAGSRAPRLREQSEWVLELLTLHPDTVRDLHRRAAEGARVDLEVSHQGALREATSLAGLLARKGELVRRPGVPVFAPTAVSGPGVVSGERTLIISKGDPKAPRKARAGTNVYLESCGDCTTAYPCDTECGWDPGKGGPNTCGEQGMPCEPYCSASWTAAEWWTGWTIHSTAYGVGACLVTSSGNRWHDQVVTTYRRERIRRTTTCPNSPSCSGCYDTEATIQVQYSQGSCYQNTFSSCGGAQTPCCSTCSVYGWGSACTWSSPCF